MTVRSSCLAPGLLFLLAALGAPTAARADGDEALTLTYHRIKTGLGVASTGVGLAGRRAGFSPVPLTTAELELEGVPAGATIERAYLYWATFGAPDAQLSFEGNATTGTLIGTSANTCWGELPHFDYTTALNRVYRADVTSTVTGNDSYTLTGFPSASATGDSQGASLVVVYTDTDETETQRGEVSIYDGAVTMDNDTGFEHTMNAPAPGDATQIELHFGAGDGQATYLEGLLKIGGKEIPAPDQFQHYRETSGTYWDALVYDLTEIVSGTSSIQFFHEPGQDCIVLAYQALFVRSFAVNGGEGGAGGAASTGGASGEPEGGAATGVGGAATGVGGAATGVGGESAGGESADGESAGGASTGDGGIATNGGASAGKAGSSSDAGDGSDGGDRSASARDGGGCGCRSSPALPSHAAAAALALALGVLRRRSKRC